MSSVYKSGNSILPIIMGMPGFMLPHYTIEFRKHFTKFHSTVVETAGGIAIGQTEAFFLYIVIHLLIAFCLHDTNNIFGKHVDFK